MDLPNKLIFLHFHFLYSISLRVVMDSRVTVVLTGIFMVELEWVIVSKLSQHLMFWNYYFQSSISVAHGFFGRCSIHISVQFTY